jgi:hypothetical protein
MDFPGCSRVLPRGIEPREYFCNYFIGNDPSRWRSGVRAYAAVVYDGLYDGIDLEFRLSGEGFKYQFSVQPGADPSVIRLSYEGAEVSVMDEEVRILTPAGAVRDGGLVAFQERPSRGRSNVEAGLVAEGNEISFRIGAHDPSLPLVIDPVVSPSLVYSTLVGGSCADYSVGLALDTFGNAFVVGGTLSQDLPVTPGAFDNVSKIVLQQSYDVFVLKLRSDGSSLQWCTFIGSTGNDYAHGIVMDDYGFPYICGNAFDFDFPTTGFAFDSTYNGYGDAFVVKLNGAGSALVYSTFIGGEYVDHGYALALDESQNVYLTGSTTSMEFPTTQGAYDRSIQAGTGLEDAFATKLLASGSAIEYSTYLGGGGVDYGLGIAVTASGRAIIAGGTDSLDFPVSLGPLQKRGGGMDAFVTELDREAGTLVYSVLIGGGSDDTAAGIALDADGNAFIAGSTGSSDFPEDRSRPVFSGWNAFASKLNANGTVLEYSRRIGGSWNDRGTAICVDNSRNAYVSGATGSSDIGATPKAAYTSWQGLDDAFLVKLDPDASHILYSTFIGGRGNDSAAALALDSGGCAYITGTTSSVDFPVTGGPQKQEDTDIFALKLKVICTPSDPNLYVTGRHREVGLAWSPPDVGADTVQYYDIYRGPSAIGLQKSMAVNGGARSAVDTGVRNGEVYYYALVAANSSGDGCMSNVVVVMPGLLPTEPWGLQALPGPGWVRLSWQAPNQTYDLPVLSYNVYRCRGQNGQPFTILSGVNTTDFIDTLASNGLTYYYSVRAVTKIGEGAPSGEAGATPSAVPSPPLDLRADVLGRKVVLNWNEPQNPGAYPVSCYNVYRRIDGDRERLLANASGRSYEVERLQAGNFHFRVTAVSPVGEGYFSGEVPVAIANRPPDVGFVVEPAQGRSDTQFAFASAAVDTDGKIANFTWYFGDGSHSFQEDPTHSYKRRGSYDIKLKVTDDDGGTAFSNGTVNVLNTPPQITAPRPSGNAAMAPGVDKVFYIIPRDSDEDVLKVAWYLDGERVGEGPEYLARFEREGVHQLRVSVDDGVDSAHKAWTVTVARPPPPPPIPVGNYVFGILSAILAAVGGLLMARTMRRRKRQRELSPAKTGKIRAKKETSGKNNGQHGRRMTDHRHRPLVTSRGKARRPAGKHSKRIL